MCQRFEMWEVGSVERLGTMLELVQKMRRTKQANQKAKETEGYVFKLDTYARLCI